MSSSTPMERAKQGDPDAISELINRSLSPKGITVSATLSRDFFKPSWLNLQPCRISRRLPNLLIKVSNP